MTEAGDPQIKSVEGGQLLTGEVFSNFADWRVRELGRQRILVDRVERPAAMRGDDSGFGTFNRKAFAGLIYGLNQERFDGILSIDLGDCFKRLYLRNGELVFAASTLMDDRLGEVIYRAGLITVDQLTEAAVQVTRTTKFGKVLLQNGVFTTSQLWQALKLQVYSIFQSLFLQNQVYVQIQEGLEASSTMVNMDLPTFDLIDDCQAYACMVEHFHRKIDLNGKVKKVDLVCERLGAIVGTFRGDTVELATSRESVAEFLSHSKLSRHNSICALFNLVHQHALELDGFDANLRHFEGTSLKTIKSQIDAYHLVLDGAKKAFSAEGMHFPLLDIELFLEQQYSFSRSPIYVLDDGTIPLESVASIYAKAQASQRQTILMAKEIQALVLFLLQLIGDLLPGGKGWEIKRSFQKMTL